LLKEQGRNRGLVKEAIRIWALERIMAAYMNIAK